MSALSASAESPGIAAGKLYVVSTPIGNLGDITYRAVEVLRSVQLIVAEDTRHSRTLLDHYDIATPSVAYHEHNEAREAPRLVRRMLSGESIALISDAGTPLLSDPGSRLVRAAVDAGLSVVPIPGPSALLAALVASGIGADRFTFLGFLPRKGGEREQALRMVARSTIPVVIYESPQRIAGTIGELVDAGCGDRDATVSRELTKKFEEVLRAPLARLAATLGDSVRGEIVLVVAGGEPRTASEDDAREMVRRLRADGASPRTIVDRLTGELGVARNVAYRLAHESSSDTPAAAPGD